MTASGKGQIKLADFHSEKKQQKTEGSFYNDDVIGVRKNSR